MATHPCFLATLEHAAKNSVPKKARCCLGSIDGANSDVVDKSLPWITLRDVTLRDVTSRHVALRRLCRIGRTRLIALRQQQNNRRHDTTKNLAKPDIPPLLEDSLTSL
mmetsp:Transcript_9603/g.20790  ORF Transcript_9603/g.20790 Transcript_9603/m.20790 type:complete len:108 (-) Transcript_9603:2420-2743(-)